jgi:hypothetical protein
MARSVRSKSRMLRECMMGSKTTSDLRLGRLTIEEGYDKLSGSQWAAPPISADTSRSRTPTPAWTALAAWALRHEPLSRLVRELLTKN